MKTKLFTLLATLLIGMISAEAAGIAVDGIYYNFDSSTRTAEVTYCGSNAGSVLNEYSGSVVIPPSVNHEGISYVVTEIGSSAFSGCTNLTTVTIPNSIISIKTMAFYNCTGLSSVELPNSIEIIGMEAFENCRNLVTITLPDSDVNIGAWAFDGCTSLPIINNIRYADTYLVEATDTTLSTYQVKENTKWIGNNAFEKCKNLIEVNLPNSLLRIEQSAFFQCIKLTNINIPEHVSFIGSCAFLNCNGLQTVYIPQNTEIIGAMAFGWCKNLKSIFVASNNPYFQSINGVLFSKDSTTLLQYPYGRHGDYVIPDSVKFILHGAFHNCKNLTSITLPSSITEIGQSAFAGCETLETVILPSSIVNIMEEAFRGCESLSIVSVEATNPPRLGNNVFKECSALTSIFVPCETKESFKNDNSWNPYSSKISYQPLPFVVNIEYDATQGYVYKSGENSICDSICNIFAEANSGYHFSQWSDGNTDNPRSFVLTRDTTFAAEFEIITSGQCGDELYWSYDNGTLSFSGSGDMYNYSTSSLPWQLFIDDITNVVFPQGITSISNYSCANMTNIEQVSIPSSVQIVGDYAFANINNRKFSEIVLPYNIKSIGSYSFAGNTYLEQIDFGSSIEYIGERAFEGCSRIVTMTCLAEMTPDVGTDALTSISSNTELYVLASALRKYQVDNNWNRFILKEYSGSTEGEYACLFRYLGKDDETIDKESVTLHLPVAPEIEGFTFIGWQPISTIIKDEVHIQAIYEADGPSSAPEVVTNPTNPAQKLLRSGNVYILTDDNVYTIQGYKIKRNK